MSETEKTPEVGQWALWTTHYNQTGVFGEVLKVTPKLLQVSHPQYGKERVNRSSVIAYFPSRDAAVARVAAAEEARQKHHPLCLEARKALTAAEGKRIRAILDALKGGQAHV